MASGPPLHHSSRTTSRGIRSHHHGVRTTRRSHRHGIRTTGRGIRTCRRTYFLGLHRGIRAHLYHHARRRGIRTNFRGLHTCSCGIRPSSSQRQSTHFRDVPFQAGCLRPCFPFLPRRFHPTGGP
jgi:hypothetical protein